MKALYNENGIWLYHPEWPEKPTGEYMDPEKYAKQFIEYKLQAFENNFKKALSEAHPFENQNRIEILAEKTSPLIDFKLILNTLYDFNWEGTVEVVEEKWCSAYCERETKCTYKVCKKRTVSRLLPSVPKQETDINDGMKFFSVNSTPQHEPFNLDEVPTLNNIVKMQNIGKMGSGKEYDNKFKIKVTYADEKPDEVVEKSECRDNVCLLSSDLNRKISVCEENGCELKKPNPVEQEKTEGDIVAMAEYLWNKWALKYEGRVYLTKDLFMLSLQDNAINRPTFKTEQPDLISPQESQEELWKIIDERLTPSNGSFLSREDQLSILKDQIVLTRKH